MMSGSYQKDGRYFHYQSATSLPAPIHCSSKHCSGRTENLWEQHDGWTWSSVGGKKSAKCSYPNITRDLPFFFKVIQTTKVFTASQTSTVGLVSLLSPKWPVIFFHIQAEQMKPMLLIRWKNSSKHAYPEISSCFRNLHKWSFKLIFRDVWGAACWKQAWYFETKLEIKSRYM